ncbi:hypothetical protein A7C99_4007 [Trichophyton rubrum]|uniref:Uncharacterized protein n=1 Tax=Trichophyton rubrum TaxID=5551 RepID=A0A178EYW3_TRIRU|nr:hypothetical protein A7C99_4007 [Trichophyton rubrum]
MVVLVGEREEERRGEERRGEKADEAREVEVAEQEVNWAHGVQGLVSTRGSVWRVTKERGRMTLDGSDGRPLSRDGLQATTAGSTGPQGALSPAGLLLGRGGVKLSDAGGVVVLLRDGEEDSDETVRTDEEAACDLTSRRRWRLTAQHRLDVAATTRASDRQATEKRR